LDEGRGFLFEYSRFYPYSVVKVIFLSWSIKKKNMPEWPNDDNGNPIPPVFLTDLCGSPVEMDLTINLLEAYGIPHLGKYPNNGLFGKLILGHAPFGVEVFVPETMLEDAQNILSADIIDDEEEEMGLLESD
jgi:hypothetical protein